MTRTRDILVLSDDWGGHPTSTIHLVRRIARTHRVFWWNTVNRMPRVSWKDLRKTARVLGRWTRGAQATSTEDAAVRASTPPLVPFFRAPGRAFNRWSLKRAWRGLVEEHGLHDPIVLTTFPSTVDFVAAVDAPLKVYYCVDEWLDYPGLDLRAGARMEAELVDAVDVFVGTSRALMEKARPGCPALYLPHGVDVEHFRPATSDDVLPAEFRAMSGPVVGFFGLLSEWVDQGVLSALADAFPDVSFVLIGASEVEVGRLQAHENMHLLGPVPYDDLPRYARAFQVGLIPFVTSRLTRAVNPLKLMEYFALGLPVLATRLPEIEGVRGPTALATTPDEFCEGLRTLLAGDPAEYAEQATAVARDNSWDARADGLLAFLERVEGRTP